jgi:hypothetical protein
VAAGDRGGGALLAAGSGLSCLRLEGRRAARRARGQPGEPLSPEIERLHDRTLEAAAAGLGLQLAGCEAGAVPAQLARLAKVNLGRAIDQRGLHALLREARR